MIQAVLFDMGNTLLEFETEPWPVLAERALRCVYDTVCARCGAAPLPPFSRFHELHTEIVAGLEAASPGREVPLSTSLGCLLERLSLPVDDRLVADLMHCHYSPVVAQVSLYPDAMATLIRLRSEGIRIGLVSNTLWPKEFHLRDLARYEILHLFDVMVFSSEHGYAKPHPAIFRDTLAELGVGASEAVFVGDRLGPDVKGAQGVGMRGVLKKHPFRTPEEGVVPDAVIEHLREIPPLLETFDRSRASASRSGRER